MTSLLTIRDNLKAFCSRYDFILTPIAKFILAMIIFTSTNQRFGNVAVLDNRMLMIMLSAICAVIPVEFTAAIASIMLILQTAKVSLDAGLLTVGFVVIFYCAYMRFFPKTGVVIFLVPIFYACHITYALPIVLAFLIGPSVVVPVIFGVFLYQYEICIGELVGVMAAATGEDDAVVGYQYIISGMIDNKEMMLTFVVFACVILITYAIYRLSFTNSWIVAFCVGGFMNVVLFLFGSVTMMLEVQILPILLGTVVGIVVAVIMQFIKGIVDYQKTDYLQFEDDEYYYYVKAIPKLSVAGRKKNVKHINSKMQN
ncbi:MAG: hypothetical protein Q4D51_04120 [Eubacteriales bacterium]|nr:hypothetical protein [Eubacteriales bacterium]